MAEIALVVGSTRNIGRAIAAGLSEDGYDVVVTSRHGAQAESVADSMPGRGFGFEVDVTRPGEIDDLFAFVDGLDGALSVLVNNVATARTSPSSTATWRRGSGPSTRTSGVST